MEGGAGATTHSPMNCQLHTENSPLHGLLIEAHLEVIPWSGSERQHSEVGGDTQQLTNHLTGGN